MLSVTPRQRDAWLYLTANPDASLREIRDALGYKNESLEGVYRLLVALEERGIIRRLPNRARSITVLHPAPVMIRGERYKFIGVGAWMATAFRIGPREDGGSLRRFKTPKPSGARITLHPDHPASRDARTIFPTRVFAPDNLQRLLKSGHNSSKIGAVVAKGRYRGFPIFTLTLEERATCPRSCREWASCYGNNMHMAQRIRHGRAYEERLWEELADKQRLHPGGFLVRLHILGDFYSADYAELWAEALEAYPALNVFGYTAHAPESEIGSIIGELLGVHPERWHIRFSGHDGPTDGSVVVDSAAETDHLICPAQTGKTDCCATCALCWQSDRTIAFLRH